MLHKKNLCDVTHHQYINPFFHYSHGSKNLQAHNILNDKLYLMRVYKVIYKYIILFSEKNMNKILMMFMFMHATLYIRKYDVLNWWIMILYEQKVTHFHTNFFLSCKTKSICLVQYTWKNIGIHTNKTSWRKAFFSILLSRIKL